MDIGRILSRSASLVWRNRALWLLGFLAALGSGGGGGGNANVNLPSGSGSGRGGTLPGLPALNDLQMQAILVAVLALICVLGILSLVFAIVGLMANGGLIAGADEADETGRTTFGRAFSRGAGRFWSLLGMRLVLAIPGIIFAVIVIALIAVVFGAAIATAVRAAGSRSNDPAAVIAALGGALCVMVPLGLILFVYDLIARGIQVFGDRAIMLEGAGAMDGLRRGWAMLKSRFGDILLMAIVLWVIGILAAIALGVVAAAIVGPGILLLLAQINTQVQTGTWILLGILILLAVVVTAALSSLLIAFRATVWTLVYRVFVARATAPAAMPPSSVG